MLGRVAPSCLPESGVLIGRSSTRVTDWVAGLPHTLFCCWGQHCLLGCSARLLGLSPGPLLFTVFIQLSFVPLFFGFIRSFVHLLFVHLLFVDLLLH